MIERCMSNYTKPSLGIGKLVRTVHRLGECRLMDFDAWPIWVAVMPKKLTKNSMIGQIYQSNVLEPTRNWYQWYEISWKVTVILTWSLSRGQCGWVVHSSLPSTRMWSFTWFTWETLVSDKSYELILIFLSNFSHSYTQAAARNQKGRDRAISVKLSSMGTRNEIWNGWCVGQLAENIFIWPKQLRILLPLWTIWNHSESAFLIILLLWLDSRPFCIGLDCRITGVRHGR